MRRHDLDTGALVFLAVVAAAFGVFLFYPLVYVLKGAFFPDGRFSLIFFPLMIKDPVLRETLTNSIGIAVTTTTFTALVAVPLALLMVRYRFVGKTLLSSLLLVPIIMPPFVGAIGVRQILGRYGAVNLLLTKLHLLAQPVDWLQGGFWCVVAMEALHLYPIMYLNLSAALANIDPNLEEAAENLGASRWRLWRTVTLPLMRPGFFAGAIIVFIWAFTDLGTPLMFDYTHVVAVQIFNMVKDINENPMGYALVVVVMAMTALFFWTSRRYLDSGGYEMMGRGHVANRETPLDGLRALPAYVFVIGLISLALVPHVSVVLTSFSQGWAMTILPQRLTTQYYSLVFAHELTSTSIRNSLLYSSLSTVLDVVFGVVIAVMLARRNIPGKALLDATAMLPLALPGIILAFGYVACFSGTFLDPRANPMPLLVISYAVRRLPFSVRAAYAGLQQVGRSLEEASQNLGAGPAATAFNITLPLISANLIAGAILAFSFSMLEVSDSLILSMSDQYHPITKAIYVLMQRLGDGPYVASAMGVLGMVLLTASLLLSGRLLGRKMGELFRV